MQGLMQDWPLTVDKILDHARAWHGDREVVTRSVEGAIVRTSYARIHRRAKQTSNALLRLGITLGDRVATLAWCTARHMEVWYGTMGLGAICHTLNPRLHPQQLAWMINHAGDRAIFVDLTFLPLVEAILPVCPSLEHVIVLTDAEHMPAFGREPGGAFKGALDFEGLIAGCPDDCAWGGFDENTAAGLCYTSGTTGDPKGVLYSHRSNFLHTLATLQTDIMGVSARDTVLAVVPMFHANGWGLAFGAPAVGAKLVMPGARLDGASLYELIESEQVTFSCAVPTLWQGLLQHLGETGAKFSSLKTVLIGGAAVSERLVAAFRDDYGVEVIHAWGMTETSPLGTVSRPTAAVAAMPPEDRLRYQLKQGRPPLGVELKVVEVTGEEVPKDGAAFGHLKVRGPFVAAAYFRSGDSILDPHGFFDTGDIATLDPEGFMQITDRSKDVIKSGGEWISTVVIETLAQSHPKTALAAVIGRPHEKWGERPLLLIKLKDGETATREDYLQFLDGKIARWWTPDDVVFVEDIPIGPTGKIDKKPLRAAFADYAFPVVAAAAVSAEGAVPGATLYAPEPEEAPQFDPPQEADEPAVEEPTPEPFPEEAAAEAPLDAAAAFDSPATAEIVEAPLTEDAAAIETEAAAPAEASSDPDPEPAAAEDLADPPPQRAPDAPPEAPLAFAPSVSAPRKPKASPGGRMEAAMGPILGLTLLPAVLALAGALGARIGLFHWTLGYEVMTVDWAPKAAVVGGAAAVFGGALALFVNRRLWRRAMVALGLAFVTMAAIGGLRLLAARTPAHDVATDWREPLTFTDRTMAERGDAASPVELDPLLPIGSGPYAGRRVADVNTETCRGASPVTVPRSPPDVYGAARDALLGAGLTLTLDDPNAGRLEATATSLLYGAQDDVAVRVRPTNGDGARVDMRSIARQPASDLGRNCRRVARVMRRLGR